MADKAAFKGLLEGHRCLDFTDAWNSLCGCLLAELGAEVIKVERPGGDPSRNFGPFYKNKPNPERSLLWFAYNTNKKGITLNVESAEGQDILKKLIPSVDLIIESFRPGFLPGLNLGYDNLRQINDKLVMTSITPFGQTGPYRDFIGSDIVLMAMGALLSTSGDSDRPPVRITAPQSYLHAGVHAASATMAAHYYCDLSGKGQSIDVSVQEAVVRSLGVELAFWEYAKKEIPRMGTRRYRGTGSTKLIWRCKDGHVCFWIALGRYGRKMGLFVEWMKQEGMAGVLSKVQDWGNVDITKLSQQELDLWEKTFAEFFLTHTKMELYQWALDKGVYLFPCASPKDIVNERQLEERDFWVNVEHPELCSTLKYPGAPYKFSLTPSRIKRRAPLIGEHNDEIYGKLGISASEIQGLKKRGSI